MNDFFRRIKERKIVNKTVIITVFILLIINNLIFFFVDIDKEFIFKYYTRSYFRLFSSIEQILFKIFPFSVGDVFYLFVFFLLSILLIKALYKLLRANFKTALWTFIDFLSIVLFLILLLNVQWNWNYRQPKIEDKFGFNIEKYETEELADFSRFLISKSAETKEGTNYSVFKGNFGSLSDIAPLGYEELAKEDDFYNYKFICVKESLFSTILPYLGISGYYNPFTTEAQITKGIPLSQQAFVINHEIAHQLGIASESEANFVAFLSTINNPLTTIQYSGYLNLLRYTLIDLDRYNYEGLDELIKTIPKDVKDDLIEINEYWTYYSNEYRKYSDQGYDIFLKINHQKHGIKSYNKVVSLAYSYYSNKNK